MPTPGGEITSTELWSNTNAVNNQTTEEVQEDIAEEEADATEQEVVEGGSEAEE